MVHQGLAQDLSESHPRPSLPVDQARGKACLYFLVSCSMDTWV